MGVGEVSVTDRQPVRAVSGAAGVADAGRAPPSGRPDHRGGEAGEHHQEGRHAPSLVGFSCKRQCTGVQTYCRFKNGNANYRFILTESAASTKSGAPFLKVREWSFITCSCLLCVLWVGWDGMIFGMKLQEIYIII